MSNPTDELNKYIEDAKNLGMDVWGLLGMVKIESNSFFNLVYFFKNCEYGNLRSVNILKNVWQEYIEIEFEDKNGSRKFEVPIIRLNPRIME